jgi:hypothetical protein
MLEARDFDVQRSDLTVGATFDRPLWGVLHDVPKLYAPLLQRLRRFGVGASQFRTEPGDGSLAGATLSAAVFNYTLWIRIRLEGFEINCPDLSRVPSDQLYPLIDALAGAIHDNDASIQFKSFAITLNLHGRPSETESKDFLRQFVAQVPAVDASLIGTGAAFYFGAAGERTMLTLTLDLSSSVSDGIFVRSHSVYAGTSLDGLRDAVAEQLRITLTALGLRLTTRVERK